MALMSVFGQSGFSDILYIHKFGSKSEFRYFLAVFRKYVK